MMRIQALVIVALMLAIHPSAWAVVIPSLGDAGDYGLFVVPNAGHGGSDGTSEPRLDVSSGAGDIDGDVAVGPDGRFDLGAGAEVTGDAFLGPSVDDGNVNGTIGGTTFLNYDLTSAINDAFQAALDFAALPDTLIADVTSNLTLGPGIYELVDIDLSSGDILTLNGTATDYFIFNITGTIDLTSGGSIVAGGSTLPNHVLFNVIGGCGTGNDDDIRGLGGADAIGTILGPCRDVTWHGDLADGAIIAHNIDFGSSGRLTQALFEPPEDQPPPPEEPVIPEPSTLGLVSLGLIGFARARRKTSLR